jgi:hypothetical protein
MWYLCLKWGSVISRRSASFSRVRGGLCSHMGSRKYWLFALFIKIFFGKHLMLLQFAYVILVSVSLSPWL